MDVFCDGFFWMRQLWFHFQMVQGGVEPVGTIVHCLLMFFFSFQNAAGMFRKNALVRQNDGEAERTRSPGSHLFTIPAHAGFVGRLLELQGAQGI